MHHHRAKKRAEEQQYEDAQYAEAAPAPAPPPPAPTQATADPLDELSRLADMHNAGQLTDDEFSAAKAKVLGT